MGTLANFFSDLENNPNALRALPGLGTAQRAELARLAANADVGKSWVVANPIGTAHLTAADGVGVVHSYYTDGRRINTPSALRMMANGEIWVASNTPGFSIARFDANFSYLGSWGNTDPATGLYYVSDFVVDETGRRLYSVSSGQHVLRAYDLDTQAMLWQFGVTGSPLNMPAGLYNPFGVDILPSGNLIVASNNGIAVGAVGNGHLSEFTPGGIFVATHASNATGGAAEPWRGSIRSPYKVRVKTGLTGSLVYCSLFSDDIIAVYDGTTMAYVGCYTKPAGVTAGAIYPQGFYVSNDHNQIVIGSSAAKLIAALDLTTHDLAWVAGTAVYDAGGAAKNRAGELWGCRDIIELSPGKYLVADDGNQRLTVISNINTYAIAYDTATALTPAGTPLIPAGWQLTASALPSGYDPVAHTLTVPLADAAAAGPIYLPIERVI